MARVSGKSDIMVAADESTLALSRRTKQRTGQSVHRTGTHSRENQKGKPSSRDTLPLTVKSIMHPSIHPSNSAIGITTPAHSSGPASSISWINAPQRRHAVAASELGSQAANGTTVQFHILGVILRPAHTNNRHTQTLMVRSSVQSICHTHTPKPPHIAPPHAPQGRGNAVPHAQVGLHSTSTKRQSG